MGAKQTRLRQIYNNMKYRCYAPNLDERTAKAYRDKGIRVCEEWLGYYGNFESWALSHGYKDGLSIDRIDPNGNYCPENCRWVTVDENRAKRGTPCGYAISLAFSVDRTWLSTGAEPFTAEEAANPAADCQDAAREPETSGNDEVKEEASPVPPTERAREIILAQMERLNLLAAEMLKPDEEGAIPQPEYYELDSISKSLVTLNAELYRTSADR